jgi:hypothetical protein
MNTAACRALKTQSWKDLYQAAICESNLIKLPGRIDDAEATLALRAPELYYAVKTTLKRRKVWTMRFALRRSLKRRPSAVQSESNLDYPRHA